jgi:hypothetical protein
MFREYKFIMLTPYNRACFINNFHQAYNHIGFKGGKNKKFCLHKKKRIQF